MSRVAEVEVAKMRHILKDHRAAFADDLALFLKLAPVEELTLHLGRWRQVEHEPDLHVLLWEIHDMLDELSRLRRVHSAALEEPYGAARTSWRRIQSAKLPEKFKEFIDDRRQQ
jgi:hypothetical protein